MSLIRRLFRWLSGIQDEEGFELVALTAEVFRSRLGQPVPEAVRVAAIGVRTGDPKPGVRIVLSNLGGLRIDGHTDPESEAVTDANGEVSVDVKIEEDVGDLAVDAPEGFGEPLLFQGRSERVTDEIYVDFPSTVVAGAGKTTGQFHATSFLGEPIVQGAFDVCAVLDDETLSVADPVEKGHGIYEFAFSFKRAGEYWLQVVDLDTDERGTKPLCVLPAAPQRIRVIGPIDPRAAMPFGEATLRVRLEDEFGNALSPGRMVATVGGAETLQLGLREGDEGNLTVRMAGFGRVPLRIADSQSGVSSDLELPFQAAWLANPGLVRLGSDYETPVYLSPPADRSIQEATVRVGYDAERTAFRSFVPGADVVSTAEAGDDAVQIQIASETALTAEALPDGVLIGTIGWSCIEAGETCFTVTAAMSPVEDPWTLCLPQKKALNSCICVNIIHPQFHNRRLKKVKKEAEDFAKIISSEANVENCCPVLSVNVETKEIARSDWKRIRKSRRRGGGGLPRLGPKKDRDLGRLYELVGAYRKSDCINIVLFPIGDAGYDGVMFKRGDRQGFGAINLSGIIKKRITQHEIGHALGLTHVEDKKNLMWKGKRSTSKGVGVELTPSQCRTIFQNLSKFPCA